MHELRVVQVGLDVIPQMGGTPTAIRDFHGAMQGRVVSLTAPQKLPGSADEDVVHVPTDPGLAGRHYSWCAAPSRQRAERVLREADLIVIHGLFRYHAQWAASIARSEGIPYWVVPHGALDPYVFSYRAWQKTPWMLLFGRPLLQGAARLIFATAREQTKAAQRVRTANAAIVHWPVECTPSLDAHPARRRVRERLGIPENGRVLLFLGRLHPMKRLLETIELLHCSRDSALHLLVVGPDSGELTEEACRQRVRALGVKGIHFVGPVFGPEKSDYFLAADAFINLSHRENFGYTVAEALMHGLPVLLSPGNDLVPELEPLDCGWFLQSLEAEEALAALRHFSRLAPEELRAMGERGRAWASRELSHEHFAERITALAQETVVQWRG